MLDNRFDKKQFHKFTGPPENWVTAIKYMTWGLEEKHRSSWEKIMPGDIFLMHSMSTNTRLKKFIKPNSGIIGFGVVGDFKKEKSEFLWIEEKENKINKWPLLVPFSEIYLFNSFPSADLVPDVTNDNLYQVAELAKQLLAKSVPLKAIPGFPPMGSFSSVKSNIVDEIFNYSKELFLVNSFKNQGEIYIPSPLLKFDEKEDIFRYETSLSFFNDINKKTINKKESLFMRDNSILERAEDAHQSTLEKIRNLFKNKGYDVYFNKHVDLFATNNKQSYLFEVKSYENRNFTIQARKGIAQLFEYEYFEIKKFYRDNKISETPIFKNLTFSQKPKDINYIEFLNSLKLGVSYFGNGDLSPIGESFGINNI